jgi:hypothetical protein
VRGLQDFEKTLTAVPGPEVETGTLFFFDVRNQEDGGRTVRAAASFEFVEYSLAETFASA